MFERKPRNAQASAQRRVRFLLAANDVQPHSSYGSMRISKSPQLALPSIRRHGLRVQRQFESLRRPHKGGMRSRFDGILEP
jgi:hypothetical protein